MVCPMYEIENDAFYDYIKQYDPDNEYHFVGEVDYHLLKDDKPYDGLRSHREALIVVFDRLAENSIRDQFSPLVYESGLGNPKYPSCRSFLRLSVLLLPPAGSKFLCNKCLTTMSNRAAALTTDGFSRW